MSLRALAASLLIALSSTNSEGADGNATVDWIASSTSVSPGESVDCVIRIRIEPSWHIYWINPGEAGMATEFELQLPHNWKADKPAFPVPTHFLSGGLGSYGYEGTVLFPLKITAPTDFTTAVTLKGKVTWLACNDGACVPGEASVTLLLTPGRPVETSHATAISDARNRIPQAAPDGLKMEVSENHGQVIFSVTSASPITIDLTDATIFPITPQVLDPSQLVRFSRSEDTWTARITKSEYALKPVEAISLLIHPSGKQSPFEISWSVNSD